MIKDQRFVCSCRAPRPMIHLGEDTGLCSICNGVYDEQLYELRLRQHTTGYTYENVEDFLRDKDSSYNG